MRPNCVVGLDSPGLIFVRSDQRSRPSPHGPRVVAEGKTFVYYICACKLTAMYIMEAAPTSSMDMIQFAVILLMAIERIIKGFTASPCRHVICKSCCSSFEIEMASPRARSASETARDEKTIDEANQS